MKEMLDSIDAEGDPLDRHDRALTLHRQVRRRAALLSARPDNGTTREAVRAALRTRPRTGCPAPGAARASS